MLTRTGDFAAFLSEAFDEDFTYAALRRAESIGRPVASAIWLADMEAKVGRVLAPGKRGPKTEVRRSGCGRVIKGRPIGCPRVGKPAKPLSHIGNVMTPSRPGPAALFAIVAPRRLLPSESRKMRVLLPSFPGTISSRPSRLRVIPSFISLEKSLTRDMRDDGKYFAARTATGV